MISFNEFNATKLDEVIKLYRKLEWNAYLNDNNKLKNAFNNSLFIYGAFDNEKLIGFIRCVGDGEHVVIVQDLIVDPSFHRQGIGKALFTYVSEKYKNVRMFSVITDIDDKKSNSFYKSFGLKPIEKGNMISYFRVK